MPGAYDQQIRRLAENIQELQAAVADRDHQLAQWQQIVRAVQDERQRVARQLLDQVRQALQGFAGRYTGLREENQKLRAYIDHQKQLHEVVARDLQGQLKYALSRIEELARERGEWRAEVNTTRQAAVKYQQQVQEQKGVINSQQAALTELKAQLEHAMRFLEMEEQYKADLAHLEREVETARSQLGAQDQTVSLKDRELRRLTETFEAFKVKANEEVQAMAQQLREAEVKTSTVDDRIGEMTALLGNSEREVAKLYAELQTERRERAKLEVQLEANAKELKTTRSKNTKLEKEISSAKGQKLSDIQAQLDRLSALNEELQAKLDAAEADKTHYMQAVEGQKGKLRPLPPPADEGQP